MPAIDPAISKEWPLLVLFIIVGTGFLVYLERQSKQFQDAMAKRDETFAQALEKQDERWTVFLAEQNAEWRGFVREAMESSNRHADLVSQRLEELGKVINQLIQDFRVHDQRQQGVRKT